jgi:hypothetical protein
VHAENGDLIQECTNKIKALGNFSKENFFTWLKNFS